MTSIHANTRRHDVTFHANGRIDITARVAKVLHLQRGDVINVRTDDNGEPVLYVHLRAHERIGRNDGAVFPTYQGKRSANNFRTYSRRICQYILQIAGTTNIARLTLGLPITKGDTTIIPIIYKYNITQP